MRKLLIVLYLVLLPCCLLADDYDDAGTSGKALTDTINRQYGNSKGVNNLLAKPLTSSDSLMSPLINKFQCSTSKKNYLDLITCQNECTSGTCAIQEENVQMQYPASKSFLILSAVPVTGGDLQITFDQDNNWDGITDWSYLLSYPFSITNRHVSGVCANGVISCDPGTWANCQYYTWATTGDMHVTLDPVADPKTMGGCYAVNNSGGTGLFINNASNILNTLGGAVVGAIQSANPHYVITQANVSVPNLNITYYGQYAQNPSSMALAPQSGPANPQSYFKQGPLLASDGSDLYNTQSSTPDTLPYIMKNAQGADQSSNIYTCSMGHNISFSGAASTPISGTVQTGAVSNAAGCNVYLYNTDITLPANTVATSAIISSVTYNDCLQISLNNSTVWTSPSWSSCGSSSPVTSPINLPINLHSGANPITFYVQVCGASGSAEFSHDVNTAIDTPTVTSYGSCNPPSGCTLRDENVCDNTGAKCIQTYSQGSPTNLKPIPFCNDYTSSYETYAVCSSGTSITYSPKSGGNVDTAATGSNLWWNIQRKYQCTSSTTTYDFTDAINRTNSIQSTIDTSTPANTTFTDVIGGSPLGGNVSTHDNLISYEPCEQACKVRSTVQVSGATVTQTGQDKVQSDYLYNSTSSQDTIKPCRLNSGTWECPIETGETIITDCGCINEFGKAVSSMSMLREATKDMKCTLTP